MTPSLTLGVTWRKPGGMFRLIILIARNSACWEEPVVPALDFDQLTSGDDQLPGPIKQFVLPVDVK